MARWRLQHGCTPTIVARLFFSRRSFCRACRRSSMPRPRRSGKNGLPHCAGSMRRNAPWPTAPRTPPSHRASATASITRGCRLTSRACAPAFRPTSRLHTPSRAIPRTGRGLPRQAAHTRIFDAGGPAMNGALVSAFQANGGIAPSAMATALVSAVFAVLLVWGVWAIRTTYVGVIRKPPQPAPVPRCRPVSGDAPHADFLPPLLT